MSFNIFIQKKLNFHKKNLIKKKITSWSSLEVHSKAQPKLDIYEKFQKNLQINQWMSNLPKYYYSSFGDHIGAPK
jgi:hypothetical protein